jgi:hypothetical protein
MGERKTTTCRSCGAEVVWLRKPNGVDRMIVDASAEAIRRCDEDEPWEPGRPDLTSHFATCKDAGEWRKRPR